MSQPLTRQWSAYIQWSRILWRPCSLLLRRIFLSQCRWCRCLFPLVVQTVWLSLPSIRSRWWIRQRWGRLGRLRVPSVCFIVFVPSRFVFFFAQLFAVRFRFHLWIWRARTGWRLTVWSCLLDRCRDWDWASSFHSCRWSGYMGIWLHVSLCWSYLARLRIWLALHWSRKVWSMGWHTTSTWLSTGKCWNRTSRGGKALRYTPWFQRSWVLQVRNCWKKSFH